MIWRTPCPENPLRLPSVEADPAASPVELRQIFSHLPASCVQLEWGFWIDGHSRQIIDEGIETRHDGRVFAEEFTQWFVYWPSIRCRLTG